MHRVPNPRRRLSVVAMGATAVLTCSAWSSATATACTPSNAVRIVALDSRFVISGNARPGRVSITFDNRGRFTHEMSLARLLPGKTLAQFTAALRASDPETATAALEQDPEDEISEPIPLGPHRSETATLRLPAGHYVVASFLPGPAGTPQDLLGLVNEFRISGAPSTDRPSHLRGVVTITDHSIKLPEDFSRGGTFAIYNRGTVPHDLALLRLGSLSDVQFTQCLDSTFVTNLPVDDCSGELNGGISEIPPGVTDYLTIHFRPGTYAYFSTAGQDPTSDIAAGLNGTFVVAQ